MVDDQVEAAAVEAFGPPVHVPRQPYVFATTGGYIVLRSTTLRSLHTFGRIIGLSIAMNLFPAWRRRKAKLECSRGFRVRHQYDHSLLHRSEEVVHRHKDGFASQLGPTAPNLLLAKQYPSLMVRIIPTCRYVFASSHLSCLRSP